MGRGSIVTAPDGGRWRVRRRWPDRPLPNLRRLWRQGREETPDVNPLDTGWWGAEIDSLWFAVAAVRRRRRGRRPAHLLRRAERVAFTVKGWRDSSEALRELRTTIAAAGPPERLAHGESLTTHPAA
jgi:hypothetical protein